MRRVVAGLAVAATVATGCVPDPPSRDDEVAEMVRFVERQRGRTFLEPPVVTFVPEGEFVARVEAMVDDEAESLDLDEVAFKALGWMNPADSLAAKYRIAFGSGVMGFYDPLTGELAVRGEELTPYRREVVVHELTHALDDQHFDLSGEFGDGLLASQQLAFLVAVEGDAANAQQSWNASRTAIEQAASLAEQLSMPVSPELLSVPIALLSLAQAPYLQGPRFVSTLGGPSGIDAMFERYPVSEEQAWFPATYHADDRPIDLPDPVSEGTEVRRGDFGVFLLTLLIQQGISIDAVVNPATAGWAGGEYVTWRAGSQSCIAIALRSDTVQQADRTRSALSTWAAGVASATITANGSDTSIRSCT